MAKKTIRLNDGQGNDLYPEAAQSGTGFVKQADGTLIQWDTVTFDVQGKTTADSLYFDFPMGFISAPYVFPVILTQRPQSYIVATRPATPTQGRVAIYNDISSTQTIYVRYLAIGRWK